MFLNFLHNDLVLMLLIVICGAYLGKIRLRSVSLGPLGVILVAFLFGHFGYILPKLFQTLGLALFIYSIGLEAGPGFFPSFQRDGVRLTIGALVLVIVGFVLSIAGGKILGVDDETTIGIFAGALTSTPSLAVVLDKLKRHDVVTAAYGVTYCFGLIGTILFVKFAAKFSHVSVAAEEAELTQKVMAITPPVGHRHLRITNPNVCGKTVRDLKLGHIAPVSITRHMAQGATRAEQVNGATVFNAGDLIRIVGTEADLDKVQLLFGEKIDQELRFEGEIINQKVVVSRRDAIGRTVGSINFMETFNIQLARVTRNGIDLPPYPTLRLHIGDILHLVGDKTAIENATKLIGNDLKATLMTDVISMLVGILVGLLIGEIPLNLPYVGTITLGMAGGVLVVALILGYLHSTKKFLWEIPLPTNHFMRELGLMFFLATVGTTTGASFIATIQQSGVKIFFTGIVVTLSTLIVSYIVCRKFMKIPFLYTMGVISGGMNNTPALSAAAMQSKTHFAFSAYATVYPVALIIKIIFTQMVFWVWGWV